MTSTSTISRRRALQAGLAGSAVLVAGCATAPSRAKPRVVVVGGGWGGLGAVRALARAGTADITLVEPNEGFMSCPLSGHYVATLQPAQGFQRSYEGVDRLGIRRVRAQATAIDRAGKVVVTTQGRLPYDFLVLSPGVDYIEDGIAGYADARAQLPVGFRAFEQAAVRAQVERFLQVGGNFVIGVPKPPYRCPPAPYERAFLIAEQVRRRGVKGKVVLVDSNPGPVPPPIARPALNAIRKVYASEIEYLTQTDMTAVDIGRRRLTTAMGDIPFTEANLVLPMRAPALVRQAGLGERWAAVQVGREIARRLAGESIAAPTAAVALPGGICWASVTHDEAIMINVGATFTPGEAPKLNFQVDEVHSTGSGKGAVEWGRMMWTNMLA